MGRISLIVFAYLLFTAQVGWAEEVITVSGNPPAVEHIPSAPQTEALDVAITPPKPLPPIQPPTDPDAAPYFSDYPEAWSKYSSSKEWCYSQYSLTGKMCLSNSPQLSKMADVATMMAPGASGMTDQCSSLGKAMKAVSTILTGYTAVCTAHVGMCGSKCGEAATSLAAVDTAHSGLSAKLGECTANCSSKYNTPPLAEKFGICEAACTAANTTQSTHYSTNAAPEKEPQTASSLANLTAQCKKRFMEKVASAGMGIVSSLATMGRANNCEEKSSVSGKSGDSVDKKSPPSMISSNGGPGNIYTSGGGLSANALNQPGPKLGDIGDGISGPGTGGPGSATDGGVGGGGAGGSGMAGGLSAGSDGKAGSAYANGYNTKIYGGDAGGGGGGRGGISGGKYAQYLPGGKNDPKADAARGPASFGISSASGKSNWQKVSERYSDQRATLITGGN